MHSHSLFQREEIVGVIPPPPGVTPNFSNPVSKAHVVIIIVIVVTSISAFSTGIRYYTALLITRSVRIDDYLLLAAWFLSLVSGILVCISTKYGVGRHLWDVPFPVYNRNFMKLGGIGGTFFNLSLMLTKLSILTLFVRFAPRGFLKIAIHSTMAIVVVYSLVVSFDWVYSCQPLDKYWDLTMDGTCIYWLKIAVFSCVMNTSTDIAILIFPIFLVQNLKLPRRQKIGVALLLMTGGFVLVVTIVKLKLTLESVHKTDVSWDIVPTTLWWMIELHLAIVCASLQAWKPFLRRYMPKLIGSGNRTSQGATRRPRRSIHTQHVPLGDGCDSMSMTNLTEQGVSCAAVNEEDDRSSDKVDHAQESAVIRKTTVITMQTVSRKETNEN